MFADLSFSIDAFSRFLRYRIAELYEPLAVPFPFPPRPGASPTPHYLDGLTIRSVQVTTSARADAFVLNERDPLGNAQSAVQPITGVAPIAAPRLAVSLLGNVLLVAEDEVARAGFADPPQVSVMIPPDLAMLLYVDVDRSGTPHLRGEPQSPATPALPTVLADAIRRLATIDQPIPIDTILGEVLPRDQAVVLNAGLALVPGERVVIRFEFGPVAGDPPSSARRHLEWGTFFAGQIPDRLGPHDWAIDLPTPPLVDLVTRQVNDELKNEKSVVFYKNSRGVWLNGFHPPGLQVSSDGHFENACGGNDVRFTVTLTARFTIPRPNVVRATVSMGFFKNDWDIARCLALMLGNPAFVSPLVVLITAFDNRGEAPFAMLLTAVPWQLIMGALVLGLLLGADDTVIRAFIRRELAKQPDVIKLPNDEYALERELGTTNPETRDWVVLTDIASAGDRLLLRGQFNVPEPILPRLTGRLGSGFGKWRREDPCNLGSAFITNASMVLGLRAAEGPPSTRPNVSLKFARGRAFDIIDDRLGVYAQVQAFSGATRYTSIRWSIPGMLEVLVSEPVAEFLDNPYPFRIRFFTSGGVRQYEIPAPPPFPRPQSIAEMRAREREDAFWRINNCFIHSSIFTIVKALQVKWLPDPPPDVVAGRHWQVHIGGLEPGRQVIAWNQATGRQLAMMRADDGGNVELSLVMHDPRSLDTVLLTLDDQPFLADEAFRELMRSAPAVAEPGPTPVSVLQTLLFPLDVVDIGAPVARVELYELDGDIHMHADVPGGVNRMFRLTYPLVAGGAFPVLPSERSTRVREALPRPRTRVVHVQGARIVQALADGCEARAEYQRSDEYVLAEYYECPWFDGGAALGPLFAQIAEDGYSVRLYRRGFAQVVRPTGRPEGDDISLPYGFGPRDEEVGRPPRK